MTDRPIIGEPRNATDGASHTVRCPDCGAVLDMRDLAAIIEHEDRCDGSDWQPWPATETIPGELVPYMVRQ